LGSAIFNERFICGERANAKMITNHVARLEQLVETDYYFAPKPDPNLEGADGLKAAACKPDFFGVSAKCQETLRQKRKSRTCVRLFHLKWVESFTLLLLPASRSSAGIPLSFSAHNGFSASFSADVPFYGRGGCYQ
jgi:hypothetical protein